VTRDILHVRSAEDREQSSWAAHRNGDWHSAWPQREWRREQISMGSGIWSCPPTAQLVG